MRYTLFPALLLALLLSACAEPATDPTTAPEPAAKAALRDVFADDFLVGGTLSRSQLRGEDDRALEIVAREMSTISPENSMKWGEIHPARDTFRWAEADAFVTFGEENEMFIIGHALVWYQQLADYVKDIKDPEEMRTALREHIDAVAGRYRGRVNGWDVLNEAIDDEGKGALRAWAVPDVLGPDYVTEIFNMARAAAPDAELYYNDYNAWQPEKRAGIVRMLKRALANGAPIDAVGIQGHYGLETPTLEEIEAAILDYHALGLPVMFTELDVSVLPNPYDGTSADPRLSFENTPYMNPYPDPTALPDSVSVALANRYQELFGLFRKHADKVTRVTFWGVYDGSTWLNNWPVRGRTNYPMLWDRNYEPKAAYDSLMVMKR